MRPVAHGELRLRAASPRSSSSTPSSATDRGQLHHAVRRARRTLGRARRSHLAGRLRDLPGLHRRVPERCSSTRSRSERVRAGSRRSRACARASHPFLRHRRQAARAPKRALDSGEVGGAASALQARGRSRHRARAGGARRAGIQRAAAGRSSRNTVRAADPPAQHRQRCRRREIDWATRAAPRVEPPAPARRRPALARAGSSSTSPARADSCAAGQRFRLDAALSRHDAAGRAARARDRRVAPSGGHRPGAAAPINQQRIAILEKSAARGVAESQRRSARANRASR